MEPHEELIRDEARATLGAALRLHRALDAAENLHRLEPRAEDASARALHEPLEEALHA